MLFIKMLVKDLKKPIILIMLIFVMLLIFLNATQIEASRKNRSFVGHDSKSLSKLQLSSLEVALMGEDLWNKYPKAAKSFEFHDLTVDNIKQAVINEEERETMRLNIFYDLQFIKNIRDSNSPLEAEQLRKDIYEMWEGVADDVEYDSIDFKPIYAMKGVEDRLLLESKVWYELYKNNLLPTYKDEANNVTLSYNYLYEVGPLLFIIIPIFIAYGAINKEINNGTLKLLITQSISRKKYYLTKWLCGVVQSFVVLLAPIIIASFFYGWKNGFVSMIYPVTYLSNIWTRIKPIPNYIEVLFKDGRQPDLGNYTFMHMAPSNGIVDDFIQPHAGIDLIPIYQYILIGLLLLVLYVGLVTAITQFISGRFNNSIVSFSVSGVVIGGSIGLTHFMTIGERYNIMPLNFFRIGRIIEGTQNVTVLSAIILLVLATALVLVLGLKYFDRKAI